MTGLGHSEPKSIRLLICRHRLVRLGVLRLKGNILLVNSFSDRYRERDSMENLPFANVVIVLSVYRRCSCVSRRELMNEWNCSRIVIVLAFCA